MVLDPKSYERIPKMRPGYCVAQIADFNTLITKSQDFRTPVFALSDEQLGHVGTVLEGDQAKKQEFFDVFSNLADRVVTLARDANGS